MTKDTPRFSVGLTYWPRNAGFGWWRAFDRGAAREELAHVASLGCDTVRFCLLWEDFQPGPQRLNSGALNALEQALEAAHAAGLRVVAALFPLALGGALQLPAWANGADPLDQLRRMARLEGPVLVAPPARGPLLLAEGRYRHNQANDLFTDAAVLAAQRYLIREVVGYFGAHPALAAWQLGEGIERVRKPASAAAAHEWLAAMAEAVREQRPGARVLGVVSAHALGMRAAPRPEHIAHTCDWLGVAADPPQPPGGARGNHARFVLFLHALAAALGRRPALVTQLGLPTVAAGQPGWNAAGQGGQPGWISDSAYGQPLRAYRGDGEQQAMLIEQALDGLQRAGAPGAWLAAYADYPPALWRQPPLDRAIRERTLGLVDAAGKEKLAAGALRRFAAQRRPALEAPAPIELDHERYWRDPRRELARLWHEFGAE
ncbi:hypothetical protein [Kouleothrix sp.]|uniref:hypothetical protein n=1 Tax=Kouleothrix sp. TaxID=2779161 RepID=UPI003919801A